VNAGAGIVLILGPNLTSQAVQTALGIPLTLQPHDNAISLTNLPVNDPLVRQIIWNGAPQVRERSDILTPMSSVQPLLPTTRMDPGALVGAPGQGHVFDAYLTNGDNPQIQEWAYL